MIGVNRSFEYGVRFYRPEIEFVPWDSQITSNFASSYSGYALVGPAAESQLSHMQLDRHFVQGYSQQCWIEFLHPVVSGYK